MKIRTKLIGTIAVGAALLIPVAQAQRPDDRAGLHGPGAFASTQTSAATHPDNRAGVRGPGTVDSAARGCPAGRSRRSPRTGRTRVAGVHARDAS